MDTPHQTTSGGFYFIPCHLRFLLWFECIVDKKVSQEKKLQNNKKK